MGIRLSNNVCKGSRIRFQLNEIFVGSGSIQPGDMAEVPAAHLVEGDVENGSIMAGQSVGMVAREEPTAAILAELVGQAERALSRNAGVEAPPP